MQRFDLKGKRAIVAGAAGKIGYTSACLLMEQGAEVTGLDTAGLSDAPFELRKADLSEPPSAAALVAEIASEPGGFDIWVNAAYPRTPDWGVGPPDETPQLWQRNVDMQLTSTCVVADAACAVMGRRADGGALVNVGEQLSGSELPPEGDRRQQSEETDLRKTFRTNLKQARLR